MNDDRLAHDWLGAAGAPAVRGGLEAIYAETARQIEARGPACWASGRCCHFARAGHRLYVTGLEAAYLWSRLREQQHSGGADAIVRLPQITAAQSAGICPYLVGNTCSVHAIKPLGCRVYFCDRSAQDWQHELTERMLGEIRALHDAHSVEYRYGEWNSMLALLASAAPR